MARKVKKSKKKVKAKKVARRTKKKAKRTPTRKAKAKRATKKLLKAERANPGRVKNLNHPEMMGDGTEEQNLNQPGNPNARIKEAEVNDAFRNPKK